MTSIELFNKMKPSKRRFFSCQRIDSCLDVNTSDIFTLFVKEAARCNAYSSDIYYSMKEIEEAFAYFKEDFEPIWVGFRRYGVDGTSFVLTRADNQDTYGVLSHNYFMLYSVTVENNGSGFYTVVLNEYMM